jgi:hypothetical protein
MRKLTNQDKNTITGTYTVRRGCAYHCDGGRNITLALLELTLWATERYISIYRG